MPEVGDVHAGARPPGDVTKWSWASKRMSMPWSFQSWSKAGSRSRYTRTGIRSSTVGSVSMPDTLTRASARAARASSRHVEPRTSPSCPRGPSGPRARTGPSRASEVGVAGSESTGSTKYTSRPRARNPSRNCSTAHVAPPWYGVARDHAAHDESGERRPDRILPRSSWAATLEPWRRVNRYGHELCPGERTDGCDDHRSGVGWLSARATAATPRSSCSGCTGSGRSARRAVLDRLGAGDVCDAAGTPAESAAPRTSRTSPARWRRAGFGADWSISYDHGTQVAGVPWANVVGRARRADLVVNVMGYLDDTDVLGAAATTVFLDIDPGFGEIWRALGLRTSSRAPARSSPSAPASARPTASCRHAGSTGSRRCRRWRSSSGTSGQHRVLRSDSPRSTASSGLRPMDTRAGPYGLRVHESAGSSTCLVESAPRSRSPSTSTRPTTPTGGAFSTPAGGCRTRGRSLRIQRGIGTTSPARRPS